MNLKKDFCLYLEMDGVFLKNWNFFGFQILDNRYAKNYHLNDVFGTFLSS